MLLLISTLNKINKLFEWCNIIHSFKKKFKKIIVSFKLMMFVNTHSQNKLLFLKSIMILIAIDWNHSKIILKNIFDILWTLRFLMFNKRKTSSIFSFCYVWLFNHNFIVLLCSIISWNNEFNIIIDFFIINLFI